MAVNVAIAMRKLGIAEDAEKNSERIPCPNCSTSEKDRCLTITKDKNMFHCHRCDASGSGIHLYGLFQGYSKQDIDGDKMLKDKLYYELGGRIASSAPQYNYSQKQNSTKAAPLETRDKTLHCLIKRLRLSVPHYNNLIARGLREQDIIENQYVSTPRVAISKLPTELRMDDLCDLEGVAGFYKQKDTWRLLKTNSGIYIPVRDISSNPFVSRLGPIQGIQIRYDDVPENSTRYKWLSTKDMESGCSAETYSHFVGYPSYEVNLTEGPLKADVIYRFIKEPVIAVPGVTSIQYLIPMLKKLWDMGTRKINVCFDMDYKNNPNVQDAYVKLLRALADFSFITQRVVWDDHYKGYDDYLLSVFLKRGGKLDTIKTED